MELNKLCNINITYTIAISHKKWFITYILLNSLNSSACHSVKSRINYSYLPWFAMLLMYNHFILTFCKIKCDITVMKEIICKPFFDYILLITCTYDELIKTIIGIFLHNVPKNRLSTYLNHWLWFKLTFFTYSCAETTC